jgi:hypothetical protein
MSKFVAPPITTADRLTITPDAGEFMYDTDLETYWGGDGATVGGIAIGTGGGGGAAWTDVTVTDANFTAANDTRYYLPSGVLSANRSVNMASITTRCQFIISEDTYILSYTGATVYGWGGAEARTSLDGRLTTTIDKISTKLIITA